MLQAICRSCPKPFYILKVQVILEILTLWFHVWSKLTLEEVKKCSLCLLASHFSLYWVYAKGVLDYLNKTASLTGSQDFVGTQPQLKSLFGLENLVNLSNQLHRELFLSNIVIGLDYHFDETPGLQVAKGRLPPYSFILLAGGLAKYDSRLWSRRRLIIVEYQISALILLKIDIIYFLFLLFNLLLNKVKIHFFLPISSRNLIESIAVLLDHFLTQCSLPIFILHSGLLLFFFFLNHFIISSFNGLRACACAIRGRFLPDRHRSLVESVSEHTCSAHQIRVPHLGLAVALEKV